MHSFADRPGIANGAVHQWLKSDIVRRIPWQEFQVFWRHIDTELSSLLNASFNKLDKGHSHHLD
jgi:hypothetical protein